LKFQSRTRKKGASTRDSTAMSLINCRYRETNLVSKYLPCKLPVFLAWRWRLRQVTNHN